jgi:hypothetical protein
MHGGKAPAVQRAARERLMALVDPAIDALLRAMNAADTCEHCGRSSDMSVMVRAARTILDRCGLGPNATLTIEPPRPKVSDVDLDDCLSLEDLELVEQILAESKARIAEISAAARRRAAMIDITPEKSE